MKFFIYVHGRLGWVLRTDGTAAAMTADQVDWWIHATRTWNEDRRQIEARHFGVTVKNHVGAAMTWEGIPVNYFQYNALARREPQAEAWLREYRRIAKHPQRQPKKWRRA